MFSENFSHFTDFFNCKKYLYNTWAWFRNTEQNFGHCNGVARVAREMNIMVNIGKSYYNLSNVCLFVCLFVPLLLPGPWADLHQTWREGGGRPRILA